MGREILFLEPPAGAVRVAYGPLEQQFGELRLPEGEGPHSGAQPFPLVVLIHGGFWRNQFGLEHMGHMGAELAREGVATWSIEYRRLGEEGGGWPGTFEDVSAGCGFARALAETYPLRLDRVAVCGFSAGGQLALWAAAEEVLEFRSAVSLAGVVDLRRAFELGLSNCVVRDLLGGGPGEVGERYQWASPVERLPVRARQHLVHGDADNVCPMELAERYVEAARAAGSEARLVRLAGATHFDVIDPRSVYWGRVRAVLLGGLG
ncbi:MAG: prolyl oligopeptidase family serine peptidase [Acidobacteria bacterium]|nr:prolyl oligopeptidase family serine peptidase [Acidobacteriota bacterium]